VQGDPHHWRFQTGWRHLQAFSLNILKTKHSSYLLPSTGTVGLLLLLLNTHAVAQSGVSNFVFTVGTSSRDAASNNWSYVVIDSPSPAVLAGRKMAVYGKAGYPTNVGAFTLRATMAQASTTATISTLLNQSVALGQDLVSMSNILNGTLDYIPGITNQSLAQKVLTAFQVSAADNSTAELLDLLSKGNPGLRLCAGTAFSEALSTTTTYELRENDPLTGAASNVVGRVTIVPNAPVVLPAPGRPFQVMTNDPSDNLLIRLRWGTPPELRRLSLLGFGYNLWRIPRGIAEAGNFQNVPPTPAQLRSNTNFTRANVSSAIFPVTQFTSGTGVGAADDPADRVTYFFADNGIPSTGTNFSSGQEFYYFVTARDLLGRDGLVSTGSLAKACRRLPPAAPEHLRVENTVLAGSTNLPRLRLSWDHNTNATDAVAEYWIYRWANPTDSLTNLATPLGHRVAVVAPRAGTNRNYYVDTSPGALTNANPSNVWYTVRAVITNACDPLFSAPAGPVWGVLRDYTGPAATTGKVLSSCGIPAVMFQALATNSTATFTQRWSMTLTCTRRDPGVSWVQFVVTAWTGEYEVATNVTTIGPIYFPPNGNLIRFDHLVDDSPIARTQKVSCVVGNANGQVSPVSSVTLPTPVPANPPRELVFSAGQLLTTALDATDPLLLAYPGALGALWMPPTSVVPDASGMVALRFNFGPSQVVLIQAQTNGIWRTLGSVAPDADRNYWVSYPACLIGPVPPFRGIALYLPNSSGCDHHITSGGPDGHTESTKVSFPLTPGTREYRVFRSTDDGPLSMFAQGPGTYDPLWTNKIIEVADEVMPPSAARICYFVQLLDEHGNGSPMSLIECKYFKPALMPRPVLSEPIPAGVMDDPQVALTWFCPTAGVRQFEVKIHRVIPLGSTGPSLSSPKLRPNAAYNTSSIFVGLKSSTLRFNEAQMTLPIGPNFGPGPQFTLTASVLPNVEYEIAVTPVDGQGEPSHEVTSESRRFTWTPPVVMANVPWPMRPLAPVHEFDDVPLADGGNDRVKARRLYSYDAGTDTRTHDKRFPVGVSIGDFSRMKGFWGGDYNTSYPNVGTTNFYRYRFYVAPAHDPNELLVYHRNSNQPERNGEPLLPIVLYRQQVTNSTFTRVSGDIIQASPLVERIPWQFISPATVIIPDLSIGMDDIEPFPICVRDLQPVLQGATYRYWVVRFNDKREPVETIPAGDVTIPEY
jgi:hypothetical protein